jgi:hypothetical protein
MPQALALAAQTVATLALLVVLALNLFVLSLAFRNAARFGMRLVTTPSFRSASRTRRPASGRCWSVVAAVISVSCLCASSPAFAQQNNTDPGIATSRVGTALASHAPDTLRQFNASLVTLTNRVSQAVVQIMVTRYGPAIEESDRNNVSHQRKIGSGVIVDSEGYILTNAHVVEGAQRIRVVLPEPAGTSPLEMSAVGKRKIREMNGGIPCRTTRS